MAVYFLNLKTFGRSGGSSAVSAAAYRAGERLTDERTGRTYDHRDRQGVLHTEIMVPHSLANEDMSWAKDRSQLWNAAEAAETRANARVAREYLVALPVDLDPSQRLALARGFARELTERYRFALDLAVHAPRDLPGSDPRNFHAHLLATTREITAHGLSAKTTLEFNDAKRHSIGLAPAVHELFFVRERWATVTNDALRGANIDVRVDHRSLAAQGIDREPYPYIPRAAFELERQGYRSGQAERLRVDYRARVEARARLDALKDRAAGAAPTQVQVQFQSPAQGQSAAQDQSQPQPPKSAAVRGADHTGGPAADAHAGAPAGTPVFKPQSLEEIRRQAREDWLRMRQEALQGAAPSSAGAASGQARDRRDDDHLSR